MHRARTLAAPPAAGDADGILIPSKSVWRVIPMLRVTARRSRLIYCAPFRCEVR